MWLELYWKKLKCYDETVNIRGNFNSASVSHLHFYFKKCDISKRPTCKNDTEIKEFTENLYYIHHHNSVRFQQTGYSDEKLVKESRLVWTRIRPGFEGEETFYEIHNKEIRLYEIELT